MVRRNSFCGLDRLLYNCRFTRFYKNEKGSDTHGVESFKLFLGWITERFGKKKVENKSENKGGYINLVVLIVFLDNKIV